MGQRFLLGWPGIAIVDDLPRMSRAWLMKRRWACILSQGLLRDFRDAAFRPRDPPWHPFPLALCPTRINALSLPDWVSSAP